VIVAVPAVGSSTTVHDAASPSVIVTVVPSSHVMVLVPPSCPR